MILGMFSRKPSVARKEYRKYVESKQDQKYESPLEGVFASSILGGVDFINKIREKYVPDQSEARNVQALNELGRKPTIQQIQDAVKKELSGEPRLSRKVQLYLCQKHTGLKLQEIGNKFGIGESGVAQAGRCVAEDIKEDKKLKRKVEKISCKLGLSRMKTCPPPCSIFIKKTSTYMF